WPSRPAAPAASAWRRAAGRRAARRSRKSNGTLAWSALAWRSATRAASEPGRTHDEVGRLASPGGVAGLPPRRRCRGPAVHDGRTGWNVQRGPAEPAGGEAARGPAPVPDEPGGPPAGARADGLEGGASPPQHRDVPSGPPGVDKGDRGVRQG